jgi:hypothetical protein
MQSCFRTCSVAEKLVLGLLASLSAAPEIHVTVHNITSDANIAGSQGVSSTAPCVISGSSSASSESALALSTFTTPSFVDNKAPPPSPSPSLPPNPFEVKLFPPVSEVIALVKANKPEEDFGELECVLLEAGIVTSEQLLLLPEDVLCVVGYMGQARARILRNHAKRIVLPLLGLRGNYEEPDIVVDREVKHCCGSQETGAESIDDIVDISESGSDNEDDKNSASNKDDTWEVS